MTASESGSKDSRESYWDHLVQSPPRSRSWREIIEEREALERLERERQLEEGRIAWLKIQTEINSIKGNETK